MFRPAIGTWIEKTCEVTRPGDRSDVAAFGSVAESTGESEIVGSRRTAMFYADDVIDLATVEGVCLGNQAVFARVVCSVGDCLT